MSSIKRNCFKGFAPTDPNKARDIGQEHTRAFLDVGACGSRGGGALFVASAGAGIDVSWRVTGEMRGTDG